MTNTTDTAELEAVARAIRDRMSYGATPQLLARAALSASHAYRKVRMFRDECRREFEMWAEDRTFTSSTDRDLAWLSWQEAQSASEGVDIEAGARAMLTDKNKHGFWESELRDFVRFAQVCAEAWGLKPKAEEE